MRFAVTARSSRGKRDRVQDNLVLDCFRKNWCHADLSLQIRPRSSNPSSSWPTSGLPTNEIKGYHVKEQGAYWFRPVLMRALQTISASSMAHHGHDHAYAAVVLAGGYEGRGIMEDFKLPLVMSSYTIVLRRTWIGFLRQGQLCSICVCLQNLRSHLGQRRLLTRTPL